MRKGLMRERAKEEPRGIAAGLFCIMCFDYSGRCSSFEARAGHRNRVRRGMPMEASGNVHCAPLLTFAAGAAASGGMCSPR